EHEVRVPQFFVTLALASSKEEARAAAERIIIDKLNILNFEILSIEVSEEGMLKTKDGIKEGRRYSVAFRELHGSIVFLHEDYEEIMKSSLGLGWSSPEF